MRCIFVSARYGFSLAATLMLAFGCGTGAPVDSEPRIAMDELAILDQLQGYDTSGAFTRVNAAPYPSEVAAGATLNVWVSSFAAVAYEAISPDAQGSGVRLPEGTLIIREVIDEAGALKKLTLMAKGPAGYNPELGDWWFGVANPDGTPVKENGANLTGKLTQCFGCHLPRANDDFLFGVSLDARPGTGEEPLPEDEEPPSDPGPVCGDFYCEAPESCSTCITDCNVCMPDDNGGDDHDDGYDDDGDDGDDDHDDGYDDDHSDDDDHHDDDSDPDGGYAMSTVTSSAARFSRQA